jgi:hypothetical protein
MEMENRYASKGVGGTALGLAIGALGVEALRGNFGGILGGGGGCCNEDHTVNRYELSMQQALAAKDSKISLLESNIYVDTKIADVYERLNGKIGAVEAAINAQAVYNATNTATIGCIQGQVAQLMGLTKVVVPNTSICPGWGDVTVSVTPAPTTTG